MDISCAYDIIFDDEELVVSYDDLIEAELQALLVEYELWTDPSDLDMW